MIIQKVRAILIFENRQVKVIKCKVINKTIQWKGYGFDIDDANYMLYKNKPCYMFNMKNTSSIDPFTGRVTKYSPEEYGKALNSKVLGRLIDALSGKVFSPEVLIGIFSVISVIMVGIFLFTKIENLNEQLVAIQGQLNRLMGVVE